jgi:O-antigen ligase
MNPLLLWIPGTALLLIGVLLLVTGTASTTGALALIGIGAAIESAGVLLWARARGQRDRRSG